jgi:chorismate mutase/prephenate dehydratase
MKKPIYGIQGGKGSFNELALDEYTKRHGIENFTVVYLYTTNNVMETLAQGTIDYGQFAIHNSIGGMVEESVHAMSKHTFTIVEEFEIIIAFHLMTKGTEPDEIDTIMAHPQALKQCRSTLERKYPKLKKISGEGDMIDPAGVANALKSGKLPQNISVLGPSILSDIYSLTIIDSNLQDQENNLTSFFMIRR